MKINESPEFKDESLFMENTTALPAYLCGTWLFWNITCVAPNLKPPSPISIDGKLPDWLFVRTSPSSSKVIGIIS